jgi:hypothetical protein
MLYVTVVTPVMYEVVEMLLLFSLRRIIRKLNN